MDAALDCIQKRAFEVDSKHAGHTVSHGLLDSYDGAPHGFKIGTDKRGQKTGSAKLPVCRRNVPDRCHRRFIIEHQTATAIDLYIDQTGGEDIAIKIPADGY